MRTIEDNKVKQYQQFGYQLEEGHNKRGVAVDLLVKKYDWKERFICFFRTVWMRIWGKTLTEMEQDQWYGVRYGKVVLITDSAARLRLPPQETTLKYLNDNVLELPFSAKLPTHELRNLLSHHEVNVVCLKDLKNQFFFGDNLKVWTKNFTLLLQKENLSLQFEQTNWVWDYLLCIPSLLIQSFFNKLDEEQQEFLLRRGLHDACNFYVKDNLAMQNLDLLTHHLELSVLIDLASPSAKDCSSTYNMSHAFKTVLVLRRPHIPMATLLNGADYKTLNEIKQHFEKHLDYFPKNITAQAILRDLNEYMTTL